MSGPFDSILNDARQPQARAKPPGRNQPCWCGSKLKYKRCHLDRDSQPGADFFGFNKRADKSRRRGPCLYPTAAGLCGKPAIGSHTIQKRGGLLAIAENGHVLTTMLGFNNLVKTEGKPKPQRIGIGEASTFPGFCSDHDGKVFALIEQKDVSPSREAAFLFYYRSLCMELVRKQQALQTIENLATMDAGMSVARQFHVQSMLSASATGIRMGISELQFYKKKADDDLLAGRLDAIEYTFVKFGAVLPIVTAFAIQQEHDWNGERMQHLGDVSKISEMVSVTVTNYEGFSWAVFVWPKNTNVGHQFARSFTSITRPDMAARLVSACFDLAENNYIDPRWWRAISEAGRADLSSQILSGIEDMHKSSGMMRKAELLHAVEAIEVVDSSS